MFIKERNEIEIKKARTASYKDDAEAVQKLMDLEERLCKSTSGSLELRAARLRWVRERIEKILSEKPSTSEA